MGRAMKAWKQFLEHQQLKRSMRRAAQRHFETTLIAHALQGWRQRTAHVMSSEHACGAVAGCEVCRHQGAPGAHSEHLAGCMHCGTRPSSAGAGPKVGKRAHVVLGRVRRAARCKRRAANQKRSQSAPRMGGLHPSQCATAAVQKQVFGMPCATADSSLVRVFCCPYGPCLLAVTYSFTFGFVLL
jgi:hypothetical protein